MQFLRLIWLKIQENVVPLHMQRLWPIFMKMAEVASYPNMNPEQQRIYMNSLNNYRTVMAAKEYDFGRGMEKGIEKEKKANAKSMKALGLDINIVSQVTGLSIEEINAL